MPTNPIKLPFNKSAAFPADAFKPVVNTDPQPDMSHFAPMSDPNNRPKFTGLPAGHQGVEMAAAANRPASTMPDTSASDAMVALGRGMPPGSSPTAAKAAEMWGTPAPAAAPPPTSSAMGTPFGPPNALSRGAPAGAASSLGGPVPVGRSRFDPQRMAEMMVRRKNPMGAQFLFGQARDKVGHEQAKELFGMNQSAMNARDQVGHEQAKELFGMNQSAMNARDQVGHEQAKELFGMNQSAADERYTQKRQDELTDEERRAAAARETFPILDPITGQPSLGHFMTGNGMALPRAGDPPEPGMTQLPGTNEFIPMFGGKPIPGMPSYTPQPVLQPVPEGQAGPPNQTTQLMPKTDMQAPKMPKVETEGGDEVLDPKTGLKTQTPKRHYYFAPDPKTGEPVKRYVRDADGNGVPDDQQGAATAAPSWSDWLKGKLK